MRYSSYHFRKLFLMSLWKVENVLRNRRLKLVKTFALVLENIENNAWFAKTKEKRGSWQLSMGCLYVGCFETLRLIKLLLNILCLSKTWRKDKGWVQRNLLQSDFVWFCFCYCNFMCGDVVATKLTDKNKVYRKYSYNTGEYWNCLQNCTLILQSSYPY